MSAFQAIFFDFDGVLLDTEPVHWACWAEMLATAGITLTWEYYRDYCIGIDDRDMLRTLARHAVPPRDWDESVGALPGQETAVSGAHDGAALRRGTDSACCPTCSAPTNSRWSVPVRQRDRTPAGGAAAYGSTSTPLSAAATSTRHKPAPEPYLLAATRLGVERALVLEDSAAGIASGRAAGFEVLAVRHPDRSGRPAAAIDWPDLPSRTDG